MGTAADVDELAVARWIDGFNKEHGYSPSVRELCAGFGWRSSSTGHDALERCIRLGYVEVVAPQRRLLKVKGI